MEILQFFLNFVSFSTIFHKLKSRSTGTGTGGGGGEGVLWLEKKFIIPGALARCVGGNPLSLSH
jgi:hypothetical protein